MSMITALSGMNAFSQLLSNSANNIANLSTPGFKASRTELADVYSGAGVTSGIGVRVSDNSSQFTQGQLTATGNTLDLSLQGNGFFTLKDNGATVLSRNGAFTIDKEGYLVNSQNQRLQGFNLDSEGNISGSIDDLSLSNQQSSPKATESVQYVLNLNSSAIAPTTTFDTANPNSYTNRISTNITDSLGKSQSLEAYFSATATDNVYDVYFSVDDMLLNNGIPAQLEFNAQGQLISPNQGLDYSDIALDSGAEPLNLSLNFNGTTQYASPFTQYATTIDGYSSGVVNQLNISPDGVIQASYSNGETQTVGQIALGNVSNAQGLQAAGNGTYISTAASGEPVFGLPGSSNLGLVQSGFLEDSTTNLASELVSLIIAQRGFEANVKAFKAADEMMGSLFDIRT